MATWKIQSGEVQQVGAGVMVVLVVTVVLLVWMKNRGSRRDAGEFPRGPPGWPILGNLPLLRTHPHRVLAELSVKQGYGPIIGLRLGSQHAVVVSSAALAKELLLTHDKIFANRPSFQFADALFYGFNSAVSISSHNPHWAWLRKILTLELFTSKRLHQLQHIRHDELRRLLRRIREASHGGTQAVDVGKLIGEMTSNTTARLLQSKTLAEVAPELPELIETILHAAVPMLSDFIPWLKCLDFLQKRHMKQLHNCLDQILDSILLERRKLMATTPGHDELPHDFLQVLLSKESNDKNEELLTAQEIKGTMLDILGGGIHTSMVTLEWAITELLCNQRCLQKICEEIDGAICKEKELVDDEDILKLPYLQSLVKEVFRLHPVIPLLVPRISTKDCKVGKYFLRKGTHALVNVWGLGRDPEIWERPEEFYPERFEGQNYELRGQNYELLPFGSGRRVCPGMRLGLSIVQVTLANLLKTFAWELPYGQSSLSIDMSEKGGIVNSKALPMLAIPKARLPF